MSIDNTQTTKYVTPTTDELTPEYDYIPCVQFGFSGNDGPKRTPRVQRLSDPIPDNATTASPVYMLTQKQYERQANVKNPYRIDGEYNSIATELQDECEADDRVLYPVHIESDEFPTEGPETLIDWFREFVEDHLEVPFNTCSLYYSGNRSIHVHVPRFVTTESELKRLKDLADGFCEDTGAKLDCGIYSRKRMFRLPGVTHEKTELKKVKIEPEWEFDRIIRESTSEVPTVENSYEMILWDVFKPQRPIEVSETLRPNKTPRDILQTLTDESFVLELETPGSEVELLTIEEEKYPDEPAERIRWLQYNSRHFSPYALSEGGSRSVAVVKIKGTPFATKDVTIGNRPSPAYALIPSYFYGARGCAGEEFTKEDEHAPLQLSKADYDKWNYNIGDNVVIIGGQSRSSIIKKVSSWQATVIGHALTGENASRQAALEYLESEGFDIGSAGPSQSTTKSSTRSSTSSSCSNTASTPDNHVSEAARLQKLAEEDGIHHLGYFDLRKVANRLLTISSWDQTWNWFETQFGDQFKPDDTREKLIQIIEYYDDFDVTIPPRRS